MEDDAPGVPEWVVTYGDMMSLLLTFFIMLVSLSEVVADKKYRAVLDSLQQYVGYRTGPLSPPGKNFPLNSMIDRMITLGSFTDADDGRGGVRTEAPPGKDFRVLRTREGKPFLVGNPILFAPGDATLSEEARKQLDDVAARLAGKPNKIEVRAHAAADRNPGESSYRQKLSLTYQRGRNVLRYLEQQHVERTRLRVTAAADIEPLPRVNDPYSPKHDRAEILILDAFADDFVGPRESAK